MQPPLANTRMLHRRKQHRMRQEFAGLDQQVDTHNVHENNPAGADVEMSNFAVAHLPFGQADKRPAGVNQRVGILTQQPIISGLAGERDGVGLGFGAISPAVEDDKDERFWAGHLFNSLVRDLRRRVQMNLPDYPDGIPLEHRVSRDDRERLFQIVLRH